MNYEYMEIAGLADTEEYWDDLEAFFRVCGSGYSKAWLMQIYAAVHRSVKDIAKDAGMSQSGLAKHFGIPRRTMEDWCRGATRCPLYTRMMMQELLGLVIREQ